jgi:hypothetical protein
MKDAFEMVCEKKIKFINDGGLTSDALSCITEIFSLKLTIYQEGK